jgi:hypothetical protein
MAHPIALMFWAKDIRPYVLCQGNSRRLFGYLCRIEPNPVKIDCGLSLFHPEKPARGFGGCHWADATKIDEFVTP